MNGYDYEQFVFVIKGGDEDGQRAKELLSLAKNKKSQLIVMALNEFAERYQINDKEDLVFTIKNHSRVKKLVGNTPLPVVEKKREIPSSEKEETIEEIEIDDSFEAQLDPIKFKNAQNKLQAFAI